MKFYPETPEKGRKCLNSSGASQPVLNSKYLIKELDYEIINFDAGDIRNKSVIDTMTKYKEQQKYCLHATDECNNKKIFRDGPMVLVLI